ncbi:Mad27 [Candidatus Magnetomoraceae bacterium gMMP-15]
MDFYEIKEDLIIEQSCGLSIAYYDDSVNDLKELILLIQNAGKHAVVWNYARGFVLNNLSEDSSLHNEDDSTLSLTKPSEAIRFIISRPQENINYILEDFHHVIGTKENINPSVCEIRSLLKELSHQMIKRQEKIYFFVPSSYELPVELLPFFNKFPINNKNKNSLLDKYGQLMIENEYINQLKPLIGADDIIERVIQILSRMESNNPLLVGYPGVGKTAVVEGFAKLLKNDDVPNNLKGRMLYSLSLNTLVAGTKYRGTFEKRLQALMDEVLKKKDQLIIFIDEMHTLLKIGSTEGSSGAGDILKPVLARGDFPTIGATTFEGSEYLSHDPAFSRRFNRIIVKEPTPGETLRILNGIAPCFEKYHKIKIEDGALMAAVDLSIKYIKDQYLPGKAIALIDSASAYCQIKKRNTMDESDVFLEIEKMKNFCI